MADIRRRWNSPRRVLVVVALAMGAVACTGPPIPTPTPTPVPEATLPLIPAQQPPDPTAGAAPEPSVSEPADLIAPGLVNPRPKAPPEDWDPLSLNATPTATPFALADPYETVVVGKRRGPMRFSYVHNPWTNTNFQRRVVEMLEFTVAGPKGAIPAITEPRFVSVKDGTRWLHPDEPVLLYRHNGDVRVYPLQILIFHEIVNDRVGGRPVVVAYSPLSGMAAVLDRTVDGDVLTFKVSGVLRGSNLVMYDLETESWWQQFTGQALVGDLAGQRLEMLPGQIVPWKQVVRSHPRGKVLSRDTGVKKVQPYYGENPYVWYDTYAGPYAPFVIGIANLRIDPVERVVGIDRGGRVIAYPFGRLVDIEVLNDQVDGDPVLILYRGDTLSELDAPRIIDSRRVGSTAVYRPVVNGRHLTFHLTEGRHLVDDQTGSVWSFQGEAVDGPLEGERLPPTAHTVAFWFAWAAFHPSSEIYGTDA